MIHFSETLVADAAAAAVATAVARLLLNVALLADVRGTARTSAVALHAAGADAAALTAALLALDVLAPTHLLAEVSRGATLLLPAVGRCAAVHVASRRGTSTLADLVSVT